MSYFRTLLAAICGDKLCYHERWVEWEQKATDLEVENMDLRRQLAEASDGLASARKERDEKYAVAGRLITRINAAREALTQ